MTPMNMDDLADALNQSKAAPKPKAERAAGGQPDLGSLLGMLGGGSQQGGGQPDLGSLLGMLGGGSQQGGGMGGPFDALVGPLAEKLGLPPQITSAVMMFLANALLAGKAGSRSGAASKDDLGDVLGMLDSGRMDSSALQNNQLVQGLSQQTGLDQETAARSIGAVVDMLGGQQGVERMTG